MKLQHLKLFCLGIFLAVMVPNWSVLQAQTLKSEPSVSGSLSVSTATNTLSPNEILEISGLYEVRLGFNFTPINGIKHGANLAFGYLVGYTYALEGDRSGDFSDPSFSYGITWGDKGIFKSVRFALGGLIPVNKETRNTSMYLALGPSLSYQIDLVGRLVLNQRWGYRHSWYEYDTAPTGQMNFPHTFSFGNYLGWDLSTQWSLGLVANYIYSIDYHGVDKSATEMGGNIGWKVAKNFSTSLGVLTRSGTLSPTGDYHRINIYDPSRAFAYWDLVLIF